MFFGLFEVTSFFLHRILVVYFLSEVPLLNTLDDLILDNIWDCAKPLVFSKDEKVDLVSKDLSQ